MRLFHPLSVLAVLVSTAAGICKADEPRDSWITFLSRRSGENVVYKMRPDGGEVTPIFGGALKGVPGLAEGEALYREPHWCYQSPDGKYFLDWARDVKVPRDNSILPRFMIYLGRLDGGPVRAIAPDGGEYAAWAPDSRKFAYSRSWQFPSLKGGLMSSPTQIIIGSSAKRVGNFEPFQISGNMHGAIVKCCGWGLIQAAALTSIPSTNLAPEMTARRRGDPFNDRQLRDALSISLKTMVRQATRLPLPLVFAVRSRTVAKVDSIGLVVRM
jgi:hypothetical protein